MDAVLWYRIHTSVSQAQQMLRLIQVTKYHLGIFLHPLIHPHQTLFIKIQFDFAYILHLLIQIHPVHWMVYAANKPTGVILL
jgi:hypothetical protein